MEQKGAQDGFGPETAGVILLIMGIGLMGLSWYMAQGLGRYEEELAALGPIFLSLSLWFFLAGFRPVEEQDFSSKWRLLITMIGPAGWFSIFLAFASSIWYVCFLDQ